MKSFRIGMKMVSYGEPMYANKFDACSILLLSNSDDSMLTRIFMSPYFSYVELVKSILYIPNSIYI